MELFSFKRKKMFYAYSSYKLIHDTEIDELGLKLKKLGREQNEKYALDGHNKGKENNFDYHPYSTIIYLKDFEGGETVVGEKTISPKKYTKGFEK